MKRLQSEGWVQEKTGRSIDRRRWGATVAEGSPVWCYATDTCRHHGVHEWPLSCSLKWQRVHTDNWGLVLAKLKSSKNKEKDHISNITQRMYQKKSPKGAAWTKNQAEGGHKWRPSWALLCEVVQALPCPPASKPVSRCLLPAAFTPSNINILVLCYTIGTLFTRQNHQLYMQGSRHWWLQNQPLSTCNCSHQAIPIWSRWAVSHGEDRTP